MNDPGYAGLYPHFADVQLAWNIAIIQTLTEQSIDRAKYTRLFPKATRFRASYLTFDKR